MDVIRYGRFEVSAYPDNHSLYCVTRRDAPRKVSVIADDLSIRQAKHIALGMHAGDVRGSVVAQLERARRSVDSVTDNQGDADDNRATAVRAINLAIELINGGSHE